MTQKQVRRLLIALMGICGVILMFVGGVSMFENQLGNELSKQALTTKGKQKQKPDYNFKNVKPVSPKTLAQAYMKRSNYKAVGQIAIPSLKINLNIYQGVGNDELNLGVGTMKKEVMGQGNYCLAGHNMDDNKTYFSPLYGHYNNLKGRKVYLMNYYTVYEYMIDKAEFIAANRVDLLDNTKQRQVSLFTCDYTGQGRLYVRGKYIGKRALNKAPKTILDAFKLK